MLHPPKGLPVRPTTDRAKEGLFNILENRMNWKGKHVLDLCCGTGNMTFEFASRGVAWVLAVDRYKGCTSFITKQAEAWGATEIDTETLDVTRFLKNKPHAFDLIFADPPYDMPAQDKLVATCLTHGWLKEDGWLILEHRKNTYLGHEEKRFMQRNYGESWFSFFSPNASL